MFKAHIHKDHIQDCNQHSIQTARYSSEALSGIGLEKTAYLCGLIHDAGKYTEEFDSYIENADAGKPAAKGSVIHTFACVRMILENYHHCYSGKDPQNEFSDLAAEFIAIAAGSHHGQFDAIGPDGHSGLDHRFRKQPEYDKRAISNFYRECISKEDLDHLFHLSVAEIEQVYRKCIDLVLSSEEPAKELLFYLSLLERMMCSAVMDGDRWDTAEFMSDGQIDFHDYVTKELGDIWSGALEHLEQRLSDFPCDTEIEKARREMSDDCAAFAEHEGGIFRLDLPTGAGKTLSGLRYALKHAKQYQKERVIFAVPLLSILDQNARVLRDAIGRDDIILEHHSNVVLERKTEEETAQRELLIDTWNSPVVITTLVQLLNTFFDGRTSAIRRFRCLANSVIIIDEVQSVPQKMLSLFNLAVNFLSKICDTTFLLCSATQPALELNSHPLKVDKARIIPPEKKKQFQQLFKRNTAVYEGACGYEEIAEKAEQHLHDYGSVLIVCNTKSEAARLFQLCSDSYDCCVHLSTAMCMAHRKKVLRDITEKLRRGQPVICVSTQLIEAGVDISFGAVIRITAGIDSIVQTAGRCNRNLENSINAPVSIADLKGENLSRLKEIQQGQNITGELISEYRRDPGQFDHDLLSEKAIRYYYRRLFQTINTSRHSTDFVTHDVNLMDLLSLNQAFVPEDLNGIILRQAFKTAGNYFEVFENNQVSVVVPYEEGKEVINELLSEKGKYDLRYAKYLLRQAGEYTVDLFQNQIDLLQRGGGIYSNADGTILFLRPNYYDRNLGVVLTGKEESEWDTLIW